MAYNTTSEWLNGVLDKTRIKIGLTPADSINDVQAILRSHRKRLLGTAISLKKIICSDEQYNEAKIYELSAYLAARSMCFISKDSSLTFELFQNFYWYSIQIIASGKIGNESVDDLIQLAECIVRSVEIYSIVAKDCMPEILHQSFEEWVSFIDNQPEAEMQDAVLGAVCVFVGRLKDPLSIE